MFSPSCEKCAEKEGGACIDCRKKKTRPYTLSGLCLYLGISKRKFNLLKNDKTFCDAVEMAMLKIETYIEENCMCGNFNGTFALANCKISDFFRNYIIQKVDCAIFALEMPHVGHYQTPVGPEKIVVLEVGRQIDVGFRSGRGLDQRGSQIYGLRRSARRRQKLGFEV